MEEPKITTIYAGSGDMYATYTVNPNKTNRYDEIKEEQKFLGKGIYNDITLAVYRCYRDGELKAEIESCSSLTIMYDEKFKKLPY